jgi:hypothetical protein
VFTLYNRIKKLPVRTKRSTVSSMQAKSCNALLRMLLVCTRISIYLKSFLRYKFLILDTYHPDTSYLRELGYADLWLFCEAKRDKRATRCGRCSSSSMNGVSLAPRNSAVSSFLHHSNLLTVFSAFSTCRFCFYLC